MRTLNAQFAFRNDGRANSLSADRRLPSSGHLQSKSLQVGRLWFDFVRVGAETGILLSNADNMRLSSGHNSATQLGQFGPSSPNFGRVRLMRGRLPPISTKSVLGATKSAPKSLDKTCPESTTIGQESAKLRPELTEVGPAPVKFGRLSTKFGPKLVDFDQDWAGNGQTRPNIDQTCPEFGRVWATRGGMLSGLRCARQLSLRGSCLTDVRVLSSYRHGECCCVGGSVELHLIVF